MRRVRLSTKNFLNMIKEELYHKTVDILYRAYFADTLVHGNCCACAVGNIVAARMGYTIKTELKESEWSEDSELEVCWLNNSGEIMPYAGYTWDQDKLDNMPMGWGAFTSTDGVGLTNTEWNNLNNVNVKEQIIATGYEPVQIVSIERAFELAKGENAEERMFNGLCAVLEVLRDIHQVTDEDLIQGNNKRFKDHYQKRLIAV